MQYTENYSLRKPQMAETASVSDLNYNSDRIDAVLADDRQISVAMYVSGNTYNTGDLVGYENSSTHHIRVYRCLVDNVTGVWDSTKWALTNLADEILDAKASGGTEVEANPTGTAVGTLTSLGINGDKYEIQGGGGGGSSYSTSEVAIATWIDGSTVYRRVFVIPTQTTQGTISLGFDIRPINLYAMTYNASESGYECIYPDTANKLNYSYGAITYSTTQSRYWLYIIVDYIKTGMPIDIIRDWDFTQSLVDSVAGDTVTLNGATRTNDGITLSTAYQYIQIANSLYKPNRAYEIDIGTCNITSGAHRRFFMYSADSGLIYRSTGRWAVYFGNWEESSITDGNAFANSTLRIEVQSNNTWKLYKDGTPIFETTLTTPSSASSFTIGASQQSCSTIQIKKFRIYNL